MGKALGNEAARRIGAATLHNRRVISWFVSSCAGERLFNQEVNAEAFVDKSFIDSGQISRRNKETTSLVISSGELAGKVAMRRQASFSSLKTADMEMMLARVTLSTDAGEWSMHCSVQLR